MIRFMLNYRVWAFKFLKISLYPLHHVNSPSPTRICCCIFTKNLIEDYLFRIFHDITECMFTKNLCYA